MVSFAAPHHQEQNTVSERQWQTIDNMARTMRVHARLSNHFFYHSVKYACEVFGALPAKGVLDENGDPTTPKFKATNVKPRLGKFKVFGCPVVFKRYALKKDNKVITKKQQDQCGARGTFVGFPPAQAGYLIYVPQQVGSHNLVVLGDVTFDENFDTAVACTRTPFAGAVLKHPIGNTQWIR